MGRHTTDTLKTLRSQLWYRGLVERGYTSPKLTDMLSCHESIRLANKEKKTFSRIESGVRLVQPSEVAAIEAAIPGSRAIYDALIWRVLLAAPSSPRACEELLVTELAARGLRLARRNESLGYIRLQGVPSENLRYCYYLHATIGRLALLDALGLSALLFRQGALCRSPMVMEEALRVVDHCSERFFAGISGASGGGSAHLAVCSRLIGASVPALAMDVTRVASLERPIVNEAWRPEYVYGAVRAGTLAMFEIEVPVDGGESPS